MIRALIVDDEEPARERLRHLLSGAAIESLEIAGEASDGDEAVAQIAALGPDLVFLDIQMPGLTGLEVAARLPCPRPRIIFCTAYDQFAVDAFELHAVDYLLKPVGRDRLVRTVTRLCGEIAGEQRQRLEREDVRRHRRERDEAARTQARLMPAAPEASGVESAALCIPAEGVGGDFYDFLAGGEDGAAFAVGDVSGKGMYAGLLAAALQARLQAIVARGAQRPHAVVSELNRLTVGTFDANRFVTLFFAAFDPASSILAYASAGHPPALVLPATGGMRLLEATGPAIGWLADARFTPSSTTLAAGDLVAVYSDGVTETASPDGAELGAEGFASILHRHRHLPARALAAAALADVSAFGAGLPAADDRTLVIVRVA